MDRTGKKIEKYLLAKKIGRGSYGEVYLSKSIENGKEFAVKCLNKNVAPT
jgi:serine/threonine protein kinase